jgi:hypothetical protein
MKPVTMPSTTHTFTAPMCDDLPVTVVEHAPDHAPDKKVDIHFSYWMPSKEELDQIKAGRPVRLGLWGCQPPVVVEVSPENEGAPVGPLSDDPRMPTKE